LPQEEQKHRLHARYAPLKSDKTMQNLKDIYGQCIIPKNTLLFRGQADISFDDCMFFVSKHWVAGALNDTLQV